MIMFNLSNRRATMGCKINSLDTYTLGEFLDFAGQVFPTAGTYQNRRYSTQV